MLPREYSQASVNRLLFRLSPTDLFQRRSARRTKNTAPMVAKIRPCSHKPEFVAGLVLQGIEEGPTQYFANDRLWEMAGGAAWDAIPGADRRPERVGRRSCVLRLASDSLVRLVRR